jgi:hypothetical protein
MDNNAGNGHSRPTLQPEGSPPAEIDVSVEPKDADPTTISHGQATAAPDLAEILMEIVAEKTGYPSEMLELEMDMEADLGIDSIKRVEILGAMEESVPGLPSVEAETLAELRTLGQIVDLMGNAEIASNSNDGQPSLEKKKVNHLKIDNTPANLIELPRSDHLEFTIPPDRPLIITNEGTELTERIWTALSDQGWNPILWNFPDSILESKESGKIPQVTQTQPGVDAISRTLDELRSSHGLPTGFIHLHPLFNNSGLFAEQEEEIVKEVFLIASALEEDLNQVDPDSRNLFLTITRTDGKLGFQNSESFQEGSGLTGLVKSLKWEWVDVFCRAIDVSRDLDGESISNFLLEEIHDPARTISEIGRSPGKRVTIERDYSSK